LLQWTFYARTLTTVIIITQEFVCQTPAHYQFDPLGEESLMDAKEALMLPMTKLAC